MKDIVRLEAASPSSNAAARLYAPLMATPPHSPVAYRQEDHSDRVSVSAAAQSLSQRALTLKEGTSAQRLASLQDRVLADSLEIDLNSIAEHMLRDMSRE